MPKLKTNRSAAKRYKVTGSGKVTRRKAFKSHLLEHKNPSRRRRISGATVISEADKNNVIKQLPYLSKM